MADPIPTTTDTTASTVVTTDSPATPPATTPARVTFTAEQQEEVNRIAANAREEGKRTAVRAPAPKPTPAPEPPKPAAIPATDSVPMTREEWEREADRREEFARATAGLDNKQVSFLRVAMKAAAPADVTSWCEEAKSTMGLGKPPAPPAVQPAAQAAPATGTTPPSPPAAAPAAPSAHALPTANGVVDLFNLSPAQLQSLGPQGVKENLEKLWAIGNQMSGAPQRPKPPSHQR